LAEARIAGSETLTDGIDVVRQTQTARQTRPLPHFEPSMLRFEPSMLHFEASMLCFEASMLCFEASMLCFEASMAPF
jgi:hypothetical protein